MRGLLCPVLLTALFAIVTADSASLRAEEARLEAEIGRLHVKASRLAHVWAQARQSGDVAEASITVDALESLELIQDEEDDAHMETNEIAFEEPPSLPTPGCNETCQRRKDELHEKQMATEEKEEKAFMDTWDQELPTQRAMGITNAHNAWAKLKQRETREVSAKQAVADVPGPQTDTPEGKQKFDEKVAELRGKRDQAQANFTRAPVDAFVNVGSWHEVSRLSAGLSTQCQAAGECFTLSSSGSQAIEECQKACDGAANCNTINYCPLDPPKDLTCYNIGSAGSATHLRNKCESKNNDRDGFRYVYNEGRGTLKAKCGQNKDCWCCRAPAGCHVTMAGQPAHLSQHPETCTLDKDKAHVRCCSEAGLGRTPTACYKSTYKAAEQHCAAEFFKAPTWVRHPSGDGRRCPTGGGRVLDLKRKTFDECGKACAESSKCKYFTVAAKTAGHTPEGTDVVDWCVGCSKAPESVPVTPDYVPMYTKLGTNSVCDITGTTAVPMTTPGSKTSTTPGISLSACHQKCESLGAQCKGFTWFDNPSVCETFSSCNKARGTPAASKCTQVEISTGSGQWDASDDVQVYTNNDWYPLPADCTKEGATCTYSLCANTLKLKVGNNGWKPSAIKWYNRNVMMSREIKDETVDYNLNQAGCPSSEGKMFRLDSKDVKNSSVSSFTACSVECDSDPEGCQFWVFDRHSMRCSRGKKYTGSIEMSNFTSGFRCVETAADVNRRNRVPLPDNECNWKCYLEKYESGNIAKSDEWARSNYNQRKHWNGGRDCSCPIGKGSAAATNNWRTTHVFKKGSTGTMSTSFALEMKPMRLCTKEELHSAHAGGKNVCGFDQKRVWTSALSEYASQQCSTASEGRCCKKHCTTCKAGDCQLTNSNGGWDIRTKLPGDDVSQLQKAKEKAAESKAKYQIALLFRQQAEAGYQREKLKVPQRQTELNIANTQSVYAAQALKAATAITRARSAVVVKLKEEHQKAKNNLEEEEFTLQQNKDNLHRLDKLIYGEKPQDCQVLDYLHRNLVMQLVHAKGFPYAEARCSELKQEETKHCDGEPESDWLKNMNDLRAEEVKIEYQHWEVGQEKGTLQGIDDALKNSTEKELLAVPIEGRMEVKQKAKAALVLQAQTVLSNQGPLSEQAESEFKKREKLEEEAKRAYRKDADDEQRLTPAGEQGQKERTVKGQEQTDKKEIAEKLKSAEVSHKQRVKALEEVYKSANDNATSIRATELNLQEIFADAKASWMRDPTPDKKQQMDAAQFDVSAAHNRTVAAEAIEEREKTNLETVIAQAPEGNSQLDEATEYNFDSHFSKDQDMSREMSSDRLFESDDSNEDQTEDITMTEDSNVLDTAMSMHKKSALRDSLDLSLELI